MAIQVSENNLSRARSGGTETRLYTLTGTDDSTAAEAAILAFSPATITAGGGRADLVRDPAVSVEPVHVDEESPEGSVWRATVRYNPPGRVSRLRTPTPIGGARIVLMTTRGGTMHRMAAIATVGAYGPGAAVTDNGDLIGVTDNGVEGVDVVVPTFSFTVERVWTVATLPALGPLHELTGRTNDAALTVTDAVEGWSLSFDAGELLFLGADFADDRGDGGVPFMYEFSASPNAPAVQVGDITGIVKGGWEYLWIRYRKGVVGGLGLPAMLPAAVYVEQVYQPGDFSILGL